MMAMVAVVVIVMMRATMVLTMIVLTTMVKMVLVTIRTGGENTRFCSLVHTMGIISCCGLMFRSKMVVLALGCCCCFPQAARG